ncbi:MAG: putative toxin-antitoxin system toxin component, PIN family [Alphaproteobacteria bacterium]|nr:putative toxin-antitoxin system toxin component, PIN family [Alphaproteobacteria bacterium]
MRIVLDTDVMVAAIRSNTGASQRIVRTLLEGRCNLILSVPLVVEYEAVMTRPEHLVASRLSADDIGALIDSLVRIAEPIHLAFLWRPQLRDPGDDMVLETAVNGQAELLVTFNKRDFGTQAAKFGIREALILVEKGR